MTKEFNKMRVKKTLPSEQVLTTTKDPFQQVNRVAVAPRRVEKKQEMPTRRQPIIEPEKVKSDGLETKAVREKVTRKHIPWVWVIAGVAIVAVVATGIFFLARRTSDGEQQSPKDPQAAISAEEAYPRETATQIDIATAEEIKLVEAGHYLLSGETTAPIVVDAPGEVVIYLNGISVSAPETPALSNMSGNPLTLILDENTTNNFQTDNTASVAIYSTGDLVITGKGELNAVGIDVLEGHEFRKEAKVNDMKVRPVVKEQDQTE